MSQNNDKLDPFGPWRTFRDQSMDTWAKALTEVVGTEAFAQALGAQLDTYLATSAPFQKAIDQYMNTTLPRLSMPTRNEVIDLARRMTNVEMRLDDLDAKIDQIHQELRSQVPVIIELLREQGPQSNGDSAIETELDTRLQALDDKTERLLHLIQTLHDQQTQTAARKGKGKQPISPEPVQELDQHDKAEEKALEGFQDQIG